MKRAVLTGPILKPAGALPETAALESSDKAFRLAFTLGTRVF